MSLDKGYWIGLLMTIVGFIALFKTHADDVVSFFIWSVVFSIGFALVLRSYVRQK